MLSICIPVYNTDARQLVNDLHHSATKAAIDFEIIVIDDASTEFVKENEALNSIANYVLNETNLGRSANRNKFFSLAGYEWLLFLDGDARLKNEQFITSYIDTINRYTEAKVFCGGTAYQSNTPEKAKVLRWQYGREREEKAASARNQNPNDAFATFNFAIHRSVLSELKFDEEITQYGHEDTIMGLELEKKGIIIHHIDNQAIHDGLDENHLFIRKTEKGLENLLELSTKYPELSQRVKALKTFYQLRNTGILWLVGLFKNTILSRLESNRGSLFLFDLYKLLYLSVLSKKRG